MKHLFVPCEIALLSREKRFKENCIASYIKRMGNIYALIGCGAIYFDHDGLSNNVFNYEFVIAAPTYSQLADWFRETHEIHITIQRCVIGSDEWEFGYSIEYLPKEFENVKRRSSEFKHISSFKEGIGTYTGTYESYYKAYDAAFEEAFKLIP